MKLKITFLVLSTLVLHFVGQGQSTMVIDPGVGFLNDLIMADTTASGERADPERIYILKRDASYLIRGVFRNFDWKLHLRAEEGAGALPLVQPFPDQEGNINSNLIRMNGDGTFENIFFDGRPADPDQPIVSRIFRTEASGMTLIVDGCILTNAVQSAVRVNNSVHKVIMTNTIVSNMGVIAQDNLGNGRVIDARGSGMDSLVLSNSTFVNVMDRVFRHRGGSGIIQYAEFDHCTIVNQMGYHGFIELGNMGDQFKFTNNLIYDGMTLGADSLDIERLTEFDGHGEVDGAGQPAVVWFGSIPNDSTTFEISNNVYTVSNELQGFYDDKGIDEAPNRLMTEHIKSNLANPTDALVKRSFSLTNIPPLMLDLMNWYWDPDGANKTKVTTSDFQMNRQDEAYWRNTLDCFYDTSDSIFVGNDNLPIGDLNWMSTITSNKNLDLDFFDLSYFPNPSKEQANLKFTLPQSSFVQVDLLDINGRYLRTIAQGLQATGEHQFPIQLDGLTTGMYFLRVVANARVGIVKILVE